MANKEIVKRSNLTGAAAVAGGAGAAAAVSAASLGATGLLGSIASVAGVTVVAATPIGWVLGAGALGAAAVGAGASLIGKKGVSEGDTKAHQQMNQDNQRKEAMKKKAQKSTSKIQQALALLEKLPDSPENQAFQSEAAIGMNKGTMNPDEVIEVCNSILNQSNIPDNEILKNTLVLLYKHMIYINGQVYDDELKMFYEIMSNDFNYSEELALELFQQAPEIDNLDKFLHILKELLPQELITLILNNLHQLAASDGHVDENEKAFLDTLDYILHNPNSTYDLAQEQTLSDKQEWHLAHDGTQLGLHSLQDIDQKFNDKQLVEHGLLVWKDGMSDWALAIEVEEIEAIIKKYRVATPPPLPSTPPPLPKI